MLARLSGRHEPQRGIINNPLEMTRAIIRRNIIPFVAGMIHPEWLFRSAKRVIIHPFYHTVSDEYLPHIHPLYSPKKIKEFEKDIDFLSRYFEAIPIDTVRVFTKNPENRTKNAFHLSFDDGLRGVYENVLPLLYRKGIPATIFINSDFTDNRHLFFRHKTGLLIDKLKKGNISKITQKKIKNRVPAGLRSIRYFEQDLLNEIALLLEVDFQEYLKTNKPYLTTEELKEMQAKGFTIGAHSINHLPFQDLDETEQIRQTIESCSYVKETFRESASYFSFPFSDEGIPDSFFKAVAGKVDLSFGITGINSRNSGKHLGRIDMEKNGRNAREALNKAFLKQYWTQAGF
jgi:peptidoglycan/xylan/chitin deacetylase (PgdA/CDA1 family)